MQTRNTEFGLYAEIIDLQVRKMGLGRDWGTAKADLPQLRAGLYGGVHEGTEEKEHKQKNPLLGAGPPRGA